MWLKVRYSVQGLASQNYPYSAGSTTIAVLFVAATRRGAGAIVCLPFLRGDLVSTPAILAIGQGHDIFVERNADKLAVTGGLELVGAVVLEWCCRLETTDTRHGTSGQRRGRCCDGVLDDGRGGGSRRVILGGRGEQQRCRCEDRGESDIHHDGGWRVFDGPGGRGRDGWYVVVVICRQTWTWA